MIKNNSTPKNKYNYLLLIVCTLFLSCNNEKNNNESAKKEALESLKQADIAFSNASNSKGMKKAFIEFMDDNGVLLRPNHYPLLGAEAIDFISQREDTSFVLTWEPKGGDIAASGELGYTYGLYQLRIKAQDTILRGTYVSIWKKKNDQWKYVLDTGNDGLGDK